MKAPMDRRGGHIMRRSVRRPAGAGIALAALVLTGAGCSHVLPLRPGPPAPRHLSTAIVLQNVLVHQQEPAGKCTSGYTPPALPAGSPPSAQATGPIATPVNSRTPDVCYREIGKPATFTSAAVTLLQQPAGPHGQPVSYGLRIILPAAEVAALTAVTTNSFESQDPLAIIVAGRTLALPYVGQPITGGQFEIPAQSKSQALKLQHMLLPSS
jgi:hypothetical protein